MNPAREVVVQRPMLERILALAGADMMLVGGQALAFWSAYYDLPAPEAAITKDVDFLGTRADVLRIARGLAAQAVFPNEHALTALVGQVRKDLPGGDYVNVDVIFRVFGNVSPEALRQRAVEAEPLGHPIKVMHPLDVLQGRLENVHGLKEKQDEHGLSQLALAIEMVRPFLVDEGRRERPGSSRPTVLKHLARIEEMALSDAGRKVARRFKLHVADAIEPSATLRLKGFAERKLPQLLALMSAARRRQLSP
jgi:hypothetical protein